MDAGESGTRQSGFSSASRRDIFSPHPRDREVPAAVERQQIRETPPNMAAATLMNPVSSYHAHNPPSFPSSYARPPPPAMPSIMSAGEPRRSPSEAEQTQRQSLPSISEVFSSAKGNTYSPTTPTTMSASQSLPPPPPPFASAAPRPDSGPESRPAPSSHEDKFFARYAPQTEATPVPGAPSSTYSYGEQRELAKPPELLPRSGNQMHGHSHSNTNPPPPALTYSQTGQLPPGQYPLSQAPPISPRHMGPPGPPFDPQRPPLPHDDDFGVHRRYDSTNLNRHFEAWGYTDCLQKIHWTARTICNFSEAYTNIASEQHGGQPIPERLPTERELSEMINNVDFIKKSLENVRELVQHTEKAREGNKHKGYDDDVSMYGDGMKQHYGIGEVKKRRGRAAPPGRCHSCNRIDTPEWRRGPDGARTLCNACGLHYAKLERKRQMDQRSLRPKAVE